MSQRESFRLSRHVDGYDLALELTGENADRLIDRALTAAETEMSRALKKESVVESGYAGIIGASAPMQALFRMMEKIKTTDSTVLVLGENGTGKELVAKGLHKTSKRAGKNFVATNCSAFNDNLLESELFGHKRGSFTGASNDKMGLFEAAHHGTFFMDEVGDMSAALQVKLLRVLQEGTLTPVGGTEQKKVDVRIIAATNRDLETMVKEKTFREDLYYRLHVVALRIPPLRDRKDDIPRLVSAFMHRLSEREKTNKTFARKAMARLMAHHWPGNVRELENEVERAWVLSGDATVIDEDVLNPALLRIQNIAPLDLVKLATLPPPAAIPATGQATTDSTPSPPPSEPNPHAIPSDLLNAPMPEAVEKLEKQMITAALERAKSNRTKAAELLGISRRNLIRKIADLGLEDLGKA